MNTIMKYRGPHDKCVAYAEHEAALDGIEPRHESVRVNKALRKMLEGWEDYAGACARDWGKIGNDSFLGQYWEDIGHALLGLLNGPRGGFDGGSLDANIRRILKANECSDER